MSRISDLIEKFPIGSKVRVSSVLPSGDLVWPHINSSMTQFFCGEELVVLGHVTHRTKGVALLLDTSGFGVLNQYFSTDWVAKVGIRSMDIELVRDGSERIRGNMVVPAPINLNEIPGAVNKKLEEIRARKKAGLVGIEETTDSSLFQAAADNTETTMMSAIGGAMAAALGTAFVKHMGKSKANANKNKLSKDKAASAIESVVEEEAVIKS